MSERSGIVNEVDGEDVANRDDEVGTMRASPLPSPEAYDIDAASTMGCSIAATAGAATTTTTTTEDDERTMLSYRRHMVDVSLLTYPIILSEIFQNTLPVVVSFCTNPSWMVDGVM